MPFQNVQFERSDISGFIGKVSAVGRITPDFFSDDPGITCFQVYGRLIGAQVIQCDDLMIAVQQIEGGGITAGGREGAQDALSVLAEIFLIVGLAQNLHVVVVVITLEVYDHGRGFSSVYAAHLVGDRVIGFECGHYVWWYGRCSSVKYKVTRA